MKFSLPLNPKLSEEQFYNFLEFCKQYKDHIFDIYFTCRIPPFFQDAMGDIFQNREDYHFAIETALFIQQETGIKISATFNNIHIRPDQKNLDLWIENFKPLYEAGVRSCTLPHTSWLLTGQIQKQFPDLYIKNTILRNITEANQVAELAHAGFNFINLDRDLMRNHDRLKEIKEVKKKYDIKLSLLANESCAGNCPIMDEHYTFNNTRINNVQFFHDAISRISCSHWENVDKSFALKVANFSPWRNDWKEYETLGIDVVKMHGRESVKVLFESLDIIHRYVNKKEILYIEFEKFLIDNQIKNKHILSWRNKIKNCKFNCWQCNFCENIIKKEKDPFIKKVNEIIADSVNSNYNNNIDGLTSPRIKKLLNSFGSISSSYLEIGVLNGATFCSVLENNNLKSIAIDLWSEEITSANGKKHFIPNKQIFIDNVKKIKGNNEVKIFESDFRKIDLDSIEYIDFMFYDAEHTREMTKQSINYFAKKFRNNAILIFDDANWSEVVAAVDEALVKNNLDIKFSRLILNDQEDEQQWWNGLYIVIIEKKNEYIRDYYNLILTKSCDKRCSFCFTHDYNINSEMSLEFIKKLLQRFPEIKGFNLLGGEPTQHGQFIEILDLLEEKEINMKLISNLLFDNKILEKIMSKKFDSILCNGMELNQDNKIEKFKYNWKHLNHKYDCLIAFTISENHTENYFKSYCNYIKSHINDIKYIRIGLDLKSKYILNNFTIGNIIKIIWETLANRDTELVFDCFIPPCIFNYKLESLTYMTHYKYQYNSACDGAIGDIFNDGSMIYCYPTKQIKIDNIFDHELEESYIIMNNKYSNDNIINDECKSCKEFNKTCSGLCSGCQ